LIVVLAIINHWHWRVFHVTLLLLGCCVVHWCLGPCLLSCPFCSVDYYGVCWHLILRLSSCPLPTDTSPPFSSYLPAGCCVLPVVTLLPPPILLMRHLRLATHCRLLSTSPPRCLSFAGWLSCRILSCCLHLALRRRLMCPTSTPCLHLHWLVVASHLVALPWPPVLLSTPLPLNAPPPYAEPATPPPICILFAPTCCRIASCGTSASHPPACPPLRLLLHLILVFPG
jgi:hypothetical protein